MLAAAYAQPDPMLTARIRSLMLRFTLLCVVFHPRLYFVPPHDGQRKILYSMSVNVSG
ncbi:hypothetical protein M3J09_001998 [Ascochyta lentis]